MLANAQTSSKCSWLNCHYYNFPMRFFDSSKLLLVFIFCVDISASPLFSSVDTDNPLQKTEWPPALGDIAPSKFESLHYKGLFANQVLAPRNISASASHYAGDWKGACSLSNYRPKNGISGASISGRFWYNAEYCGACLLVRSPGGKSVVTMVRSTHRHLGLWD
jgi:hypothetical protein